jgi:hypothetical protein
MEKRPIYIIPVNDCLWLQICSWLMHSLVGGPQGYLLICPDAPPSREGSGFDVLVFISFFFFFLFFFSFASVRKETLRLQKKNKYKKQKLQNFLKFILEQYSELLFKYT